MKLVYALSKMYGGIVVLPVAASMLPNVGGGMAGGRGLEKNSHPLHRAMSGMQGMVCVDVCVGDGSLT